MVIDERLVVGKMVVADGAAERKLIVVRGVRVTPGSSVRLAELADGWATFPDFAAVGRRIQWVIGVSIVVLIPIDVLVTKLGFLDAEGLIAAAIVVLLLSLAVVGNLTDDRSMLLRRRIRNDSMLRAGGRSALRTAVRTHGRARTVGQMNILLGSLGRTDPVFSRRRIVSARVDRRWWRTVVELRITGDHALRYRVYGVRAPTRLARVFASEPA